MKLLLLASFGGAIGAGLRFLVNEAFAGPDIVRGVTVFPWATVTVNVVGSFLMGAVMVMLWERYDSNPEMRALLATGILGGFTTFSAFSLDLLDLYTGRSMGSAAVYAVGSVALSFGALLAGMASVRWALQ